MVWVDGTIYVQDLWISSSLELRFEGQRKEAYYRPAANLKFARKGTDMT